MVLTFKLEKKLVVPLKFEEERFVFFLKEGRKASNIQSLLFKGKIIAALVAKTSEIIVSQDQRRGVKAQ